MLFNVNLWVMAIAGRRETFLKHKYIRSEGGYGHEDYAMNIELAAAGFRIGWCQERCTFIERNR